MRQTPELIDVFADIVEAMNGDDTADYTPLLLNLYPPVNSYDSIPVMTTLTDLLRKVIGDSYRAVQYYPGHPKEIIGAINEKDWGSHKYEKFPAVCLFLDTAEQHGQKAWAYDANNLQLVILYYTEPTLSTADRHKQNFKPILLPIYRELIRQVAKRATQTAEELVRHTKINHYFWGKEGLYGSEGNIFNDHLDCLEIRSLQMSLNYEACSNNNI